MLTTGYRAIVSLAVVALLPLVGCARQTSTAMADSESSQATPVTIRFDNDAMVPVRVYLIGNRREWALGRVEPGQETRLRVPEESFAEPAGTIRLAVLADATPSVRAALDPRTAFAVAQPVSTIASLRWRFSAGNAAPPQLTVIGPDRARR